MPVDLPAAGFEPEVVDDQAHRAERAIAVPERDVHAGIPKANDVGPAVTGHVGEEARVPVDPPAAGFEPEVVDDETNRAERAVAV